MASVLPRADAVESSSSTPDWMIARLNVSTTIVSYYAISLVALIGVFILGHWTRQLAWNASRLSVSYPITASSR